MVERFFSISLFFLLTWAAGFTVLRVSKAKRLEFYPYQLLAEIAVGVAVFSFLGIIFNILRIPIHIISYSIVLALYPLFVLVKNVILPRTVQKKGKNTDKKSGTKNSQKWSRKSIKKFFLSEEMLIFVLLIIICSVFLSIYLKGAFGYPYLEDDDPWTHTVSMSYVAQEHTYHASDEQRALNGHVHFYMEPYPPSYDVLMGVMWQTNHSLYWTMKFYNVLLVMLTLPFCFLFFREYLKSNQKALFSVLVLATLPSFMSHNMWSQTLAMMLIPVAYFCLLRAMKDKAWIPAAMIAIGSQLVTQPVVSFIFGCSVLLMFVFVLLRDSLNNKKSVWTKRFAESRRIFIAGLGGVLISCIYWFEQLFRWGLGGIFAKKGGELTSGWASAYTLQVYALKDIIFAPYGSRIDQAVGWGPWICLLLIIGLFIIFLTRAKTLNISKEWRYYHTLIWFFVIAYILFAPTLGVPGGWGSGRMWAYLAFPLAIIVTEGAFLLSSSLGALAGKKKQLVALVLILLFAFAISWTNIPPKKAVQTAQWPPGVHWANPQIEIPGYIQMKDTLPRNSRVFNLCSDSGYRSLGYDMMAEPWNVDEARFKQILPNVTGEDITAFLELRKYEYLTFDATCVSRFGENETQYLLNELQRVQRFEPVIQNQGFLLARII